MKTVEFALRSQRESFIPMGFHIKLVVRRSASAVGNFDAYSSHKLCQGIGNVCCCSTVFPVSKVHLVYDFHVDVSWTDQADDSQSKGHISSSHQSINQLGKKTNDKFS